MERLDVPLFRNSAKDIHCVQATLQMILKYFFPQRRYTLKYLDKITYHYPGGWTWDTAALLFLSNLGFEIIIIDEFDFKAFGREGLGYLRSIWDKERFQIESLNTDLRFESQLAQDFLTSPRNMTFHKRKGCREDITTLFHKKYLVVPNINAYVLDNEEGHCGHHVIVTGIDRKGLCFNDAGLPAIKDRYVSWDLFEKSRTEKSNIFAVKIPT
ncbi:MAG: hypothetical protein COU90_03560 [Candidatus Ryanbacteria bacterium CG10_big_fil_rev_8_21_14_0_10_43_42]|uniref:Peptidase C39-like domain-containing protein n=1 Tax=Candidatus Ryanbacteria bacterium CG10_big_fil_rev_8_21_14_0_10_43_42 TaxID=1974864 RepID=A0A2M8KWI6_9BACT|nr:MAG: hypothetical protein COU90_03560 [Candidatus Ryanbacteria bacterium CG10_big_fil_rev_8_21_14_0_10_43_42]